MKESQAVTTIVEIYFEPKIRSVREFHQIGNGILNGIPWTVALLYNVMSLLIVKDTASETETFLKNVK